MRWFLVLAGFVLLAGAVTAQPLSIGTVTLEPEGPLDPLQGKQEAVVPVRIACEDALVWSGAGLFGQVRLRFTAEPSMHGIIVVAPADVAVPVAPCLAGEEALWHEARFLLRATERAPGETPIPLLFRAEVMAGSIFGPAEGEAADEDEADVEVAFLGRVAARVDSAVATGAPGDVLEYRIDLETRGNARAVVRAELLGEAPEAWPVILPDPVVLEARGGESVQRVVVLVDTPEGPAPKEQVFRLRFVPVSTVDEGNEGQAVELNLLARVGPLEGARHGAAPDATAEAPGVPAAFLLAALGAAWLRRGLRPQ